ncbi:MAG: BCCT family transporter [Gammaproteobacteria bacterium]
MKNLKIHHKLTYQFYLPIIILSALFALIFTKYITCLTFLSSIFIVPILCLLITPFGKIVLGTKNNSRPLLHIVLFQISIFLIFYAVMESMFIVVDKPQGIISISLKQFASWGLFPWTGATLCALAIAYQKQVLNKQKTSLITSLDLILQKNRHGILGMGAELFLRQGFIFIAGLSLGSIALLIYVIFYRLIGAKALTHASLVTGFLFIGLYALTNSPLYRDNIRKIWQKHLSLSHALLLQAGVLTLALILATPLAKLVADYFGMPGVQEKLTHLLHHQNPYVLNLFIWSWWLTAIPFLTTKFATLIEGLSIRRAIVYLLIFPLIITLFGITLLPSIKPWFSAIPWVFHLAFFAGIVLLIAYFVLSKDFDNRILVTLHKTETRSRVALKIYRGILQIAVVLPLLYLLIGLYGIGVYYFAITGTCIVVVGGIALGLMKTWYRNTFL